MKGRLVPVVLAPRYTSVLGAGDWTSVPLNVEAFARVSLSIWRGPMPGTSPTFAAYVEHSHDADVWVALNSTAIDPGEDAVTGVAYELPRRWLRMRVELGGSGNLGVSYFAEGHLELRVDGAGGPLS